jgi:uncharacterized cupredoxin-like copper-binding protein
MRIVIVLSLALAAALLAACGGDDDATSTPGVPTATRTPSASHGAVTATGAGGESFIVSVGLKDYEIVPNPGSGPAGEFEFQISNTGPSVHELHLVKTDLAADELPTDSDGAVDESDEFAHDDHLGHVEDLAAGSQETFEASLDPGHYVLYCNIVEQAGGGVVAHYTQGMRQDFTVE